MNRSGRGSRPYLDIGVVTALTVGALAAALAAPSVPYLDAVRVAVGLPFLLFVPGYVVVTAVYPRAGTDGGVDGSIGVGAVSGHALSGIERLVTAAIGSLAVVGAVSLAAEFSPWGIRIVPIIGGLAAVSLVGAAVAAFRRRSVSPQNCPDLAATTRRVLGAIRSEFAVETTGGVVLNVFVVVSLVVMLGGVGYAATERPSAEQYSEFAVLTENADGELTAIGHPKNVSSNAETPIHVRISNHEGERTNYTVVVQLVWVTSQNGSTTVTEATELDQFRVAVGDGQTRSVRHTLSPEMTGEDLRLTYHFYAGPAGDDPTRATSDKSLWLWVDVAGNETS